MSKLTVRFAEPGDSEKCAEYMSKTKGNLVDPEVFKYPTTNTLVVENGEEPELFFPFQAVLVVESLGVKPGLSAMEESKALNKAYIAIESLALNLGVREIMFLCNDETLIQFVERRGFEKIKWTVMRRKVHPVALQ